MITLNRLLLSIAAIGEPQTDTRYGFDIPFYPGLNIIAGQNSRGKSTIGSCIYYALGMEELLELNAANEKALGKALKTAFNTNNPDTGDVINHTVMTSRVFLEVQNDRGEIVTIARYINSGDFDNNGSDRRAKRVVIYASRLDDISAEISATPYFLRNNNNNTDDFGFYHWLASFIGLDLPEVLNSSVRGRSPLYLQAIFAAAFVEQTKGWSEFLATIPYFGIAKAKEKVIEFLLDLRELSISTQRDDIEKEEQQLIRSWDHTVSRLDHLASEFSGLLQGLPDKITPDYDSLKTVVFFVNDEQYGERTINFLLETFEAEQVALGRLPVKRVGENKAYIREKLEKLYIEQETFMKKFHEFDVALNIQKSQRENISKHLVTINRELNAQKGIKNVIEESLIVSDVYDKCPTCQQTVSDDLMESEGVKIEKYTLDQNISYLSGQQQIIKSSIGSLETVIEEKERMRKYYLNKQRQFEEDIKTILRELIDDDRDYSDTDSLRRVRLEKKVNDFRYGVQRFERLIDTLRKTVVLYQDLLYRRNKLEGNIAEDTAKLKDFENVFKNDYLFPFGYDSNQPYNIYIQREEPFKYFPVFKFSETHQLPQSIKTNSSASDFVRTMWAYLLTLIVKGRNHPGILLLDEPGQHAVKSKSLQTLFEKSAAIKDRQVIIMTSIQKVLIREGKQTIDRLDLDSLLEKLTINKDYHIYRLPDTGKSISKLD